MEIQVPISKLRENRIFVATPMYGGMCSGMYTKASADLATTATKYNIDVKFFYLFNESLITRARNYCVDEFLRSDYTHLMFIDADICFSPDYIMTLSALCDETKPIIGGPYPKKVIAWEKVRNAVDKGLADVDPTELEKFTGDFVFNPHEGVTQISLGEPTEVLEVGTGFMMIRREALETFREKYPKFSYKPDHNRSEHFSGDRYIHAFFDTVIDNDTWLGEGHSNNSDRYLSEDYMFCQLAHKIGLTTWLCPWMDLQHVGTYVFNGTLKDLGRLDYAAHGADMEHRPHKETRQKALTAKSDTQRVDKSKPDTSNHQQKPHHKKHKKHRK
jgi:hypothetical protein